MITSGHEAFLLTLLFGVTGYITHSVATRFSFRRNERPELLLLRFLAYGTVNVLVSLPVIALHTRLLPRETWTAILTQNLPAYYGLTFWVLFLIPTLLGILFGLVPYLYDVQAWYRAPVAGWDERIARSRGQWVLISLDGGARVAGFLGRESSVVSDTGEKDLYLQTLWHADADGAWRKVPRSRGMLISGRLIQSIEFWEDESAKPTSLRVRLRAWAASEGGRTPPDFRSSLITDIITDVAGTKEAAGTAAGKELAPSGPALPEMALSEVGPASRPEEAAAETSGAVGPTQAGSRNVNGSGATSKPEKVTLEKNQP